ncbi:hypothetical protein GCM10010178_26300 [Lentzea flava]|uniref:RNA polymerase sigma-70 region 2 domain-containing protein n=2 Tax=Lentzea flava TaxID=103732 RepID=A0ABQ2UIW4_9PSEU|nr:hypothetical protein GCM10010178_26300 [Lentzea flava]
MTSPSRSAEQCDGKAATRELQDARTTLDGLVIGERQIFRLRVKAMREAKSISNLVSEAVQGDEIAWRHIVRSYTPLVRAVCREHGLTGADSDDVSSRVWMRLLLGISRIREPAALAAWLRTTTRRQCLLLLKENKHDTPLDDETVAHPAEAPADEEMLAEEQRVLLRQATEGLTEQDRRLLSLLFSDPPTPYARISEMLGIATGSIGPTRQRILLRLRQAPVWSTYQPTF